MSYTLTPFENLIVRIFGMLFSGALTGIVLYYQYLAWRWGEKSKHWPFVHGKITFAEVEKWGWTSRATFYPEIKYKYTVNNQSYTGKRIEFGIRFGLAESTAESIIGAHRVGKQTKVYYNPDNPKLATLKTGVPCGSYAVGWIISGMFGSIFIVWAIGAIGGILRAIGWMP